MRGYGGRWGDHGGGRRWMRAHVGEEVLMHVRVLVLMVVNVGPQEGGQAPHRTEGTGSTQTPQGTVLGGEEPRVQFPPQQV